MHDIQSRIRSLKRPSLLVQAALYGIDDFRRDRDLKRSLKTDNVPRIADALMQLLDIEELLNDARLAKAASYTIARHIDVLTAIMSEARLLRASYKPKVVD